MSEQQGFARYKREGVSEGDCIYIAPCVSLSIYIYIYTYTYIEYKYVPDTVINKYSLYTPNTSRTTGESVWSTWIYQSLLLRVYPV